jgi:predicted ATPase
MVKIDQIKIKGYKNIDQADLKLGNFNVIIGANNSGKSNFIQSISFLNYIVNSSLDEVERSFNKGFAQTIFREVAPRSSFRAIKTIKNFNENGQMEFELAFSNSVTNRIFNYQLVIEWVSDSYKKKYKIKTEKLDVKESSRPGPMSTIFSRTDEYVKYGAEFSKMDVIERVPSHFSVLRLLKIVAEVHEEYKDAVNSLNEILKTPIFYFSNIELLKSDSERLNTFNGRVVSFELKEEIIALEESENWDIFKEALLNILNIENVEITKIGNSPDQEKIPITKFLIFTHNGIYKTLDQFSDGTLLIIALITKVLSTKNHLFLIEEPENSTHPKALLDLIGFIKSFSESTQFIITSHSIAILNKTKIDDIIASTMNENGLSELYNVSSRKDLKNKLRKSTVNFSDELFFNLDDKNEFE